MTWLTIIIFALLFVLLAVFCLSGIAVSLICVALIVLTIVKLVKKCKAKKQNRN